MYETRLKENLKKVLKNYIEVNTVNVSIKQKLKFFKLFDERVTNKNIIFIYSNPCNVIIKHVINNSLHVLINDYYQKKQKI